MRRNDGFGVDEGWRIVFAHLGVDPADVFRMAGLPADLLNHAPTVLSTDGFFRLWLALETTIDDPLFPLKVVESLSVDVFTPAVFTMMCGPDLRTSAARLAVYKRLTCPMVLEVEEVDAGLRITARFLDPTVVPPASWVACELGWWVQIVRAATRHPVDPVAVVAPVALPDADAVAAWFGVPIQLGDRVAITFSDADASRPFLTSNARIWQVFEPDLRRRLAELDRSATTADRVRAVLLEALPTGQTGVDHVAKRLAMSRRTLQRRLAQDGVTFQGVLRDVRTDLARHYLERTELSASEIGYLLGFEETSSFYRAFHAWTGMTPESARRSTSR